MTNKLIRGRKMTDNNIYLDECYDCQEEKEGEYAGDYDNPIFLCPSCISQRQNDFENEIRDK